MLRTANYHIFVGCSSPDTPYCLNKCLTQQRESLECDFGTESRYEAIWLDNSTVKCSGVTVSSDNNLPEIASEAICYMYCLIELTLVMFQAYFLAVFNLISLNLVLMS